MADVVYPPIIRVALGLFRSLDLRFDVRGQEHVPATGGAVVVMNHVGYLDFAIAGVPFWYAHKRFVRFMAKDDVFRHLVGGLFMRGMHHIPVDRTAGADAYAAAVAALRAGELVGVFPEATISESFCLKDFKTGAARMAVEAGVPLLPLVLWGSQRVMTKGRKRDLRAARHTPVTISVGAPISAAPGDDPVELTARLRTVMGRMLAEAQADYSDRPTAEQDGWWLPQHLGGTAPTPAEAAARHDAAVAERLARKEREAGGS